MEWIDINEQDPPNELIEVKDQQGNIAYAYPTYYPFKMDNGKVIPCAEYWDGGFMVQAKGLDDALESQVTHWKEANI
jgi:hypothetical protein